MVAKKRAKSKGKSSKKKKKNAPEAVVAAATGKPTPVPAWNLTPSDCLEEYDTNLETGLNSKQAAELFDLWGPNSLDKEDKKSMWELFVEQFDDPLVKILLGAAAISFFIAYSKTPGAGDDSHGEGKSILMYCVESGESGSFPVVFCGHQVLVR